MEFKASWDPATTGYQVLRTICAFANDFHNVNGGYVVIGVAERDGRAVLPPAGLSATEVDAAQTWIRGHCNRMDPRYPPILSPETIGDRTILVVWAPASEMRPHRAPSGEGRERRYWVRIGSSTVNAEQPGNLLQGLIQQTARVPWDDRRARDTRIEDLREAKVREHLRDIRSGLLDEPNAVTVYRRLRITARVNDHEVPKNVGLLFFAHDPSEWYRGARIEVVQFAADRAGDVLEERVFSGGLVDQLRGCLSYLENVSAHHIQKQTDRSQVRGWVSYPLPALRETLVNAVYHRGYAEDQPEPTKVYLYPGRIEVISYPGPVPGIEADNLLPNAEIRPAPARNRRIGEVLKELGLAEGRLTGLPRVFQAMAANGSPVPCFDFDEERTWFRATLPAHPEYEALSALRDAAHLRALGEHQKAFDRIEAAWHSRRDSAVLASEMVRLYAERGETRLARQVLVAFEVEGPTSAAPHVANTLAEALMEAGEEDQARALLQQRRVGVFGRDAIDAAILARRAHDQQTAHQYFERAGEAVYADARALLEFAQTKLALALTPHVEQQRDLKRRFLQEARPLLERVVQLDAAPIRHAWAWRELARTLHWLRAPARDVEDAYQKAIELHPDEGRFVRELERFRGIRK
ncbi:MAG: putative DNA binding domain-containing protein [Acidobacteria bacterium]|nr:putative DNA binding domain-containing protein [Acidobacteriota bacterium]